MTVRPRTAVALSVTAHDADQGDTLTYTWTAQDGNLSAASASSTTWTAPDTLGSYQIGITVHDRQQKGATASVRIVVSDGQPPQGEAVPIPGWAALLLLCVLAVIGRTSVRKKRVG